MPKAESQIKVSERSPLKWAEGWNRVPIGDRQPKKVWKKSFANYRDALVNELAKVGVSEVVITFNSDPQAARLDPGVTVYFSRPLKEDFSWQVALGIDDPAPTLQQIDDAYRKKAMQHHPDRGGDMEIFKSLGRHREQAKAWISGTHGRDHEYALPCDRFTEPRWNLNALRLGLAALRRLEEFGLPGMLERTFRGFRVALAAKPSSEAGDEQTVSA